MDAVEQVKTVCKANNSIEFIQLDVTNPASIDQAVEDVKQRVGTLDVLINNAGVGTCPSCYLLISCPGLATKGPSFDAEIVQQAMNVNYGGTRDVTLLPNLLIIIIVLF